ncbi:hypothetical protein [Dyadobacter chenhuakuii]|uniref:Uncharacterized protein n=1 Tax=Dyadobacter chenhuakuii TaxID=2909339 RepID=A0A9X1QKZ3_9BACT|nr:hypothetical protein [Dyadobacter chenhuakuii]MCF2496530.1 hypothetical protein [Dyadobacter chenhuakuii]MCF2501574.1 hypothetical protein [Dyadobacter chenhuakuii]USJ30587.1 hypothetical protein NFI80_22345 [Dyadobacter chenhuakuii]
MKKIEEQLESIEEVLSLVIRKNASIEKLIQTASESQNKTLSDTLIELKKHLKHNLSSQYLETYLSQIQQAVLNVPKESQVRHHHHFDIQSKGFIISAAALLLSTAISIAVAISYYNESSRLKETDLKFRVARQLSPALTARVDSIYYEDPALAELETQKREANELTIKEAEELLKHKQMEAKKAKELLKQLKKE